MNGISRVVAVALLAVLALPAQADGTDGCTAYIDAAPAVADQPGTWCLANDIRTTADEWTAVTVATDDVTIDCRGHLIDGTANLAGGYGTAIRYSGPGGDYEGDNITVRNCVIRGYLIGIGLYGGSGHLVEDNTVSGSITSGINMTAERSTIRRNRVLDLYAPDVPQTTPQAISADGSIDVLDNVVSGIRTNAWPPLSIGILVAGRGTVARNRIEGLPDVGDSWGVRGIWVDATSFDLVLRDNVVVSKGELGIVCSTSSARGNVIAVGNVVQGFRTAIGGCPMGHGNVAP